ncbi:MAG: hypothetical protein NC452_15530 [Eubacterium sp.]|nr:hypothetical protein [Eubacterium sp.]
MTSIYTNMDWKATPSYNPANGTAGEPNPETGIVKCQPGTTARTDEVEINFCRDLSDENAAKIREYAELAKNGAEGSKQLAATSSDVTAQSSEEASAVKFVHTAIDAYDKTAVASDGSTFSVRYASGDRNNYLSGMKNVAAGTAESLANVRYSINIKADITSYFSTASSRKSDEHAILQAYKSALDEISQNIADGKSDPTSDLKTTVTINGTEWNFAELLNTVEKMNKSFEYFDTKGNLDYPDYAKMGVSKADVKNWAKENLSDDKQRVISEALDARVETFIQREKEDLESFRNIWDKPGFVMPEEKAKYYETHVLSATNKEARITIMKLFEETDYSSSSAVSNTVNKYKNMMSPILLAFGATNSVLPEYLNSAVNDIFKYISGLFGGKTAQGLNVSV